MGKHAEIIYYLRNGKDVECFFPSSLRMMNLDDPTGAGQARIPHEEEVNLSCRLSTLHYCPHHQRLTSPAICHPKMHQERSLGVKDKRHNSNERIINFANQKISEGIQELRNSMLFENTNRMIRSQELFRNLYFRKYRNEIGISENARNKTKLHIFSCSQHRLVQTQQE